MDKPIYTQAQFDAAVAQAIEACAQIAGAPHWKTVVRNECRARAEAIRALPATEAPKPVANRGVRLWIAKAETEEYGTVFLPDYADLDALSVASKVMDAAKRDGFNGALNERLEMLGWKIVRVTLTEEPE